MLTKVPRIEGIQTAIVTDHEGSPEAPPEIHCDDWARVRVRFPWDQRDDGKPSSKWIRVSQVWAGAGYGALYIPRVGQEVLVAYLQGDPDNPTIVGRVYNVKNPLPLNAGKSPEQSTLKSQSTPNAEGSNELRFNDLASAEEIHLHAQRNLDEVVRVDHTTRVGQDQKNAVGRDQMNEVGGDQSNRVMNDRTHVVGADERARVGGDRSHDVEGKETVTVGSARVTTVGADHTVSVGGDRSIHVKKNLTQNIDENETASVSGDRKRSVGGNEAITVDGHRTSSVDGADRLRVGESRFVSVAKSHSTEAGGDVSSSADGSHRFTSKDMAIALTEALTTDSASTTMTQKDSFTVKVGGCTLELGPGFVRIDNGAGAQITLAGGNAVVNASGTTTIVGGTVDINP
jgi:type VI secretion system secreted protein VgrG